jgi:transposase
MSDEIDAGSNGSLTFASHSAASRLIESLTPARRRYERWPDEKRGRIVAESFAPDVTVSQVARENGVGLGLLHYWRRHACAAGAVEEMRFVPVTVAQEQRCEGAGLELIVRDVTVRIRGADRVKLLRHDGSGAVMPTNVLHRGHFPWPSAADGIARLTSAQLAMLGEGIDWKRPNWGAPPAHVG